MRTPRPGARGTLLPGFLRKLNPLRGLPNPREVVSWGLYDLANQSFTLLIITLLFSLYVQQVVTPQPEFSPEQVQMLEQVRAGEREADGETESMLAELDRARARGDWNWSLLHGGSLLIVVIVSPLLGALADSRGWRKQVLITTGFVCVTMTAGLWFVGPGMLVMAALLYIPANIAYQLGENFLASFLPAISSSRTIGRVSAIGWSMGYLGALLLLICLGLGMLVFGLEKTEDWRPLFVFAAFWFLAFMVPVILFLRDDEADRIKDNGSLYAESVGRFAQTVRNAAQYRQLMIFLTAFFVYGLGMQTVIGFASIIAKGFGIEGMALVGFVLQITVTAGLAAFVTSKFQDRIGCRATLIFYLSVWIVSCLGLVWLTVSAIAPQWAFWVIGNGLGFALGGTGTASRSMVGRFAPLHRTAEFFGLWGTAYRLAGALGVLSFGFVRSRIGDGASIVLLTSFFAVGLILLLRVNETAGYRVAQREQRDHIRKTGSVGL